MLLCVRHGADRLRQPSLPVKSKTELANFLLTRWSEMLTVRAPLEPKWQELADYCSPRKAEITTKRDFPDIDKNVRLYDSTAVYANTTLANGQLAYMTPADTRWFQFDPPRFMAQEDKAKAWYSQCSDIAQATLANSNFYAEVHELYFDDSTFGTYSLFCDESAGENPFVFQSVPICKYAISENAEGKIDTMFREIELTLLQAAEKFGEKNLSEQLQGHLRDYRASGKGGTVKHTFLHAIYPRKPSEREAGKEDPENKPFASIYLEKSSKHVCMVSGFDEQPFFAGRHLKHNNSVYGFSPAWVALADARQLNFLVKQLDALAETKAFPRMLIPSTHEGEIDLRSAGITYFDPTNPNAIPREWATQGDYQIGLEREQRKADNINRAFHVDMFRMFSELDKQMTAREVNERASEKLVQFSPTFALKTTELFNPLLRRIFGMHLRRGLFPPPPREALSLNEDTGVPEIPQPEIVYVSRVALAIKGLHNVAMLRTMENTLAMVQVQPDILDNYDLDKATRGMALNDGVPTEWMRPMDTVEEMRAQRAQQQQAMQEQQSQLALADSAAKVGSIKADSAVGQMMGQQMAG